jgi:hypothetical protein
MSAHRRSFLTGAAVVLLAAAAAVLALTVLRGGGGPARAASSDAFSSFGRSDDTVVLWAVGDSDVNDAGREVARRIEADRPRRLLYMGDVYEVGSPEEFRGFGDVYGSLLGRMAPTPGDHEWPRHADGYDPFWRAATGSPTPRWYAFSAGAWRILSLNSEEADDPEQLEWVRRELAGDEKCVMAYWHRPRFTAGYHGDQEDLEPLWRAVRDRAALVLNGHDHDLERMRPHDGVVEEVVGAGGRPLRDVNEDDPRLAFATDDEYGALRLKLAPDEAQLTLVAADDGAMLDRATVPCRG